MRRRWSRLLGDLSRVLDEKRTPGGGSVTVRDLPTLNAILNSAAALLLVAGWWLIRSGRREAHQKAMLAGLRFSIAFLVSYLIYHAQVGSVRFPGTGGVRTVYLSILLTHTVLAAAVPFLAADHPPVRALGSSASRPTAPSRAGRCRSGSTFR